MSVRTMNSLSRVTQNRGGGPPLKGHVGWAENKAHTHSLVEMEAQKAMDGLWVSSHYPFEFILQRNPLYRNMDV